MTKKILILSNVLWTISTFRRYLIKALIDEGYEVVCVADMDDFSDTSIDTIASLGARFVRIQTDRKGVNPLSDLIYTKNLFSVFEQERPDLIINYTIKPVIYGTVASKLANIPSFAVLTGLGSSFIKKGLLNQIVMSLYKIALTYSKKVFFLNETDKDIFTSLRLCPDHIMEVLPGEGIDTDEYDRCPAIPDPYFRFILIARLLKDKGVYEYIEAARIIKQRFPKTCFYLAGAFDEDNPSAIHPSEVQKWHTEGAIDYLGKTDMIIDFFSMADVVVLPSYREGLSRLLLEAASCQKPIITTDVPGCKEIVEDGINGFLCKAGNSASLAESMEKMLALSPKELHRFGINGRQRTVKYFGKDHVNAIMLKAIKDVLV